MVGRAGAAAIVRRKTTRIDDGPRDAVDPLQGWTETVPSPRRYGCPVSGV